MKILALIPARKGSKRFPGKNIRILGDKPLIAWSIESALEIPTICCVLVSTDSSDIADISKKYGAFVPWLRPSELATDTASSVDVAIHALDWYEKKNGPSDGLLLLQPTSPFREKETILKGLEIFQNTRKTIIGVNLTHSHPMWTMKIMDGFLVPFINSEGLNQRFQDLEPAYVVNGCFYLISPDSLRKNKSFVDSESLPLIIQTNRESLDIDTEEDFHLAEYFLKTI